MTKPWRPYALHILDAITKLRRIEARGDLTQDEVLYDAALRNLQTLSEATQALPEKRSTLGIRYTSGNNRCYRNLQMKYRWAHRREMMCSFV